MQQQPHGISSTTRRAQVVDLLATGILRVLAGRALTESHLVAVQPPGARFQAPASPPRPTAGSVRR